MSRELHRIRARVILACIRSRLALRHAARAHRTPNAARHAAWKADHA